MEEKLYYGNTVIGTIPAGWRKVKIDHKLVDIRSGFAYPKNKAVAIGVPHLRPFNVGTNGQIVMSKDTIHIPLNFREDLERYNLLPGDILYNNTNSVEWVGKSALVRHKMKVAFSNHINRLRVKDKNLIDPRWLALSLRSLQDQKFFATHCNKWIGQAGFGIKKIHQVEIALPPLAIQRRIMIQLEALLADLRQMQALNCEVQEDSARAMEQVLAEIFREGLKKEWPQKSLQELIIGKPQYGISVKPTIEPVGIPILRMGNISNGQVVFDNLKYVELSKKQEKKYLLHEGDLLFNRTNSAELVGKSAVYMDGPPCVFASYLIRVVANPKKALPQFIVAYINSPFGRRYIQSQLSRAIGQTNVNAKKLQAMPIPIPSIPEQQYIVTTLEAIESELAIMQEIQAQGEQSLQEVEHIILAKAFRGEL